MTRRLVPLVLLALVALAGCSNEVNTAAPQPQPMGPENPSRPPTPQTWLDRVCTALTPAVRSATPVPEVVRADLVGSRDRMIAYIDERVAAFDSGADGVNAAGPAPTAAGQAVTEPVVRLLRDRAVTLTRLREDLRTVPAVSEGTLFDTLQRVRGQLVLAGPAAIPPRLALPPDLAAQAAQVPSCQALGLG